MFLLHTEGQFAKLDLNRDSFLDLPLNYQVNAMNRWDYDKPGKFEGRTLVSYLWEDRVGGQKNFSPRRRDETVYGLRIRTDKFNVITKNGFCCRDTTKVSERLFVYISPNLSYFVERL